MAQQAADSTSASSFPASFTGPGLFPTVVKAALLVAGLVILLWFLHQTLTVLLFFFFALILAIALNPVVTWLEKHHLPRWAGTALVVLAIGGIVWGLYALIAPEVRAQINQLAENLPGYLDQVGQRIYGWFNGSILDRRMGGLSDGSLQELLPAARNLLLRVGQYTINLITGLFMLLVLFGTIVYTLVNPRPLLKGYIEAFPLAQRDRAARAFAHWSEAVVGWLRANVILGAIEAVGAAIFLPLLGVPGAMVFAILTFFAELVPKIGIWIMALPPTLVALAIDPMKALWVYLAYVVMLTVVQNFIGPFVRGRQMKLHPVTVLFAVVALTAAFGIVGALIATPLVSLVKAFYNEFYLKPQPDDGKVDDRVEAMLTRRGVEPQAG